MALQLAETLDHYFSSISKSPINQLARSKCSYTLWNDQSLAQQLKPSLPNGVDLVIMHPSAEGGMPHTRAPALICLPAYYPESKQQETIQHELVHISQRRSPEVWNTRAVKEGWKRVADSVIPERWLSRCRLNPDTFHSRFFAWQGRYVPLPIFVREDTPDLRDIEIFWYDIQEETATRKTPSSFTEKYGNLQMSSVEHPYELWAYKK